MASDLLAWAEKTAPTLTDEDWGNLEKGLWFTASYRREKRIALLTYVEQLALLPRRFLLCLESGHGREGTHRALVELRLRKDDRSITALGRAVLRARVQVEGRGDE